MRRQKCVAGDGVTAEALAPAKVRAAIDLKEAPRNALQPVDFPRQRFRRVLLRVPNAGRNDALSALRDAVPRFHAMQAHDRDRPFEVARVGQTGVPNFAWYLDRMQPRDCTDQELLATIATLGTALAIAGIIGIGLAIYSGDAAGAKNGRCVRNATSKRCQLWERPAQNIKLP